MAKTKNEDQIVETAAALLTAIKKAAEFYESPGDIKTLAEAYAAVASVDPAAPRTPARAVSFS